VYTATVKGGISGVTDPAGNPLQADAIWSFTTTLPETTPPTVTSTAPGNGATGTSVNTTVTGTFSEAMDASTLTTGTVELRDAANVLVPSTVSYDIGSLTVMLVPNTPLDSATTYTATIKGGANGAADDAGNPLANDVSWSFTTRSGVTIWDDSIVPSQIAGDTQAIEVGVKFRSSVDGFVTGIRFYKGANNTGPHVGNLWTSAGTLVSTVNFSNETVSGWQQADLPAAVPITANTTYIVS
jgi:hypothetical protein